jgi:hypothetical protein
MKTRLTAAALAVAAGAAFALPTVASADIGGLAVAPAHPDPAVPTSRTYFTLQMAPGSSADEQVRVTDTAGNPIDVLVNAVDGLTSTNSGAVYANRQDPVSKTGTWVTPSVSTLTVSPTSTQDVDFTVTVPPDATPGDHLAGIAFEDASPTTTGQGVQVTTVVRSVIGVLVQVPGPAAFDMSVSGASIQPLTAGNLPSIVVDLGDIGQKLGKPDLNVTLNGPDGYTHTVSRQLDTLLPGDSIAYPMPWPDSLPPGDYTITVSASGAGMAAPVTYTTTDHLGAALQTATTTPHANVATHPAIAPSPAAAMPAWVVPALAGAGGLIALTVVVVVMFVVRIRRRWTPVR